jgi:hypothetical protein
MNHDLDEIKNLIKSESIESLYTFLQVIFPDQEQMYEIFNNLHENTSTNKLILKIIHVFILIKDKKYININTQNDYGYTLLTVLLYYLNWGKEMFRINYENEMYDALDEDDFNYYFNENIEEVLYTDTFLEEDIIKIFIKFKRYIYILLHDKKIKLFIKDNDDTDAIDLIQHVNDPEIIKWLNKRISIKKIQDIPNIKKSPMKTLYDITKKYAAKPFVLNNKFLLRLTKQNKITRNRYRQFLNIKKQKTNIRRHTSPNSSLFYKSKTKKRKNTRSKKSV